jgi:hypothetical protein
VLSSLLIKLQQKQRKVSPHLLGRTMPGWCEDFSSDSPNFHSHIHE